MSYSRAVLLHAGFLLLSGCSLLTIDSPAEPLPERDLNARMLTRDYALYFGTAVAIKSNEIVANEQDVNARVAALTWKIVAASEVAVAATRMSPMLSLLDTWTLVAQMDSFFRADAQAAFFGNHHDGALVTSGLLLTEISELVERVTTPDEYRRYSALVNAHVAEYPLTNLGFARVPLSNNRSIDQFEELSLQTVGTAPEAMSDIADRLRLYTVLLRYSTQWQVELFALKSGLNEGDVIATLERLDGHFAELATFARQSPEMMDQAADDLERVLLHSSDDIEQSALAIIEAVRLEREMFMAGLDNNWERMYGAIDTQRSAAANDIERIALQVSNDLWSNVRGTIREIMGMIILFAILLLTLPFIGGYYVGRARANGG